MDKGQADSVYRAWRMLLTVQASTTHSLQKELRSHGQVAIDIYDVLTTLYEAPEYRMRMSDLAERILFSRSGLTRLIDRLETKGWVRREACEDDRRGWYASLTPEGDRVRKAAQAVYVPRLQSTWNKVLTDEERTSLESILAKVSNASTGRIHD